MLHKIPHGVAVWGLTVQEGLVRRPKSATGQAGTANPAVALTRVAGWATTEFDWEFRPECRGLYPFTVPCLATAFPFGLLRARKSLPAASELTVWPQTIPLDVLLDSTQQRSAEDRLCEHRVGDCGDMLGTRVFRQGDPLRRVHWAQTARHGQMIVCERQAAVQMAVRIVLDLEQQVHVGEGSQSSLEWAIRLAASVAHLYHRQYAAVECRLGSELFRVPGGDLGWKRFLDQLARIPREGNVTQQPLSTCSHHRHEVLEVIVTTDLRLKLQPELQHPCGRQRCVVLQTAAFQTATMQPAHLCAAHHWVVIDSPEDIAGQFQRKWRRVCHEH